MLGPTHIPQSVMSKGFYQREMHFQKPLLNELTQPQELAKTNTTVLHHFGRLAVVDRCAAERAACKKKELLADEIAPSTNLKNAGHGLEKMDIIDPVAARKAEKLAEKVFRQERKASKRSEKMPEHIVMHAKEHARKNAISKMRDQKYLQNTDF